MAIRPVLRMGDPRLFEPARPVAQLNTPELHGLIADMQQKAPGETEPGGQNQS